MPVYKLTPVNPDSQSWEASTHKGACIIRAGTEQEARREAHLAFTIATGRPPGEKIPTPPWTSPGETQCTRLTDHAYGEDGPDEVLDPPYFKKK